MIVASRSVSAGDMPAAGSSSSSRRGCGGERDRHLELPPLAVRERGGRPRARSPRARRARAARRPRRRARASGARRRGARRPCAAAARAARCRRSSARANRLECWNVCAMPSRTRWCSGKPRDVARRRSAPGPSDTRSAPRMSLNSVLLPAPLGPISPWRAPASSRRSTPSTARRPPKTRETPSQLEQRRHAGLPRSRASAPAMPPGSR